MTIPSGVVVLVLAVALLSGARSVEALNTHALSVNKVAGQYVSLPDTGTVSVDLTSSFTLEAWIRNSGPYTQHPIITKWLEVGNSRNYIFAYQDNGFVLAINDTGETGHGQNLFVPYSLTQGVWTHVAVSYNTTTGIATFYVNGSPIGTATGTISFLTNGGAEFRIGSIQHENLTAFLDIDEARVWTVVRSQNEIQAHMSHELSAPQPGLAGYWKLNQNAADSSGNNNNLTEVNTPLYTTNTPFNDTPVTPSALEVTKAVTETKTTTSLTPDNTLTLTIPAHSSYTVDALLKVLSTSAKGDFTFSVRAPQGVISTLSYVVDKKSTPLAANEQSKKINVTRKSASEIVIRGTATTGAEDAVITILWAPVKNSTDGASVQSGSSMKATLSP